MILVVLLPSNHPDIRTAVGSPQWVPHPPERAVNEPENAEDRHHHQGAGADQQRDGDRHDHDKCHQRQEGQPVAASSAEDP